MNYFNHRVAMNHQLYQDAKDAATQRRMARRRIAHRRITAAIRQHNKLVALNMTLRSRNC